MSAQSRRSLWASIAAGVLVLAGCVGPDGTEIEPLQGLDRLPGHEGDDTTSTDSTDLAAPPETDDQAGDSVHADAEGAGIDLDDTPYDERELPPDEPAPPVEAGAPPPDRGVAAPPGGGPPPPPPSGPLDPDVLLGIGDYCSLWRTYGGIGAAFDQALISGPPERTSEVIRFMAALHQRSGDLSGPEHRADHQAMVGVLDGLHALLGEFGHDFDAFLEASETDPSLLQRFGSVQAPADGAMSRIDAHVASACGVTLA